jgi:hypothetical protein
MTMKRRTRTTNAEQQYYVYFLEPPTWRRCLHVHKHTRRTGRDRWLYMPSLDLVKRIAASDKRTSFAGSDFLYEDISGRAITEDTHELIGETDTEYILESTPKRPESVEFSHYHAHGDKTTFLPMHLRFFKNGDRPYRTFDGDQGRKHPSRGKTARLSSTHGDRVRGQGSGIRQRHGHVLFPDRL